MKILDRLPVLAADTLAPVAAETVRLKKDEIVVWVSLTVATATQADPTAQRFPAILDTAHTHNFAIQERHLVRWAGISLGALRRLGQIRHAGTRVPLHAAKVWLHPNRPGEAIVSGNSPHSLILLSGIAVFPNSTAYPRVPLLGMRAILSIHLHVTIDGQNATVTMRTPDWRARLLSWLSL